MNEKWILVLGTVLFLFKVDFVLTELNGQNQAQAQPGSEQEPSLKRSQSARLFYSKECQDDIGRYCTRRKEQTEMSDIAVLQCIHNQVSDLSLIDKECHNLLYAFKKNLTANLKLDSSALNICKDDLKTLNECQSADKANGHLISCLLDNKDNITNTGCKSFLNSVAALVFSDYRLIYNFISDCGDDIERHSCGRLEKMDDDKPTQQGKTIECLSQKFQNLDSKCKTQIVRITELQSDDFHLDRVLFFACRDDREKFCDRVPSGNGRVYKCLIKNKFNSLMSKECQDQLTRRQKIIAEDVSADRTLIQACKKDIIQHKCRGELRTNGSDATKLASLILCLEGAIREGDKIEPDCLSELIEHRRALMSDYQLNPDVVKFCSKEIDNYCGGGVERDGKTLHCLLRKAKQSRINKNPNIEFTNECIRELRTLIKVVDASEDVRVDPDLQEACQNILNNQCKNTRPGKGRIVQCLLDNLNKPDMTDDCEERLLEIQFFVARDWKLTPSLYSACKVDAIQYCQASASWQEGSTNVENGPLVLPCLYHHIHEQEDGDEDDDKSSENKVKISKNCVIEVKKAMSTRALSIDLIPEVQDQCSEDLAKFCSNNKLNTKGEELRCLQENFKQLDKDCQQAIEKYTAETSQDISLDKILMKSCMPTIDEFCSDKKDEKGELLECLIKQKNNGKIQEKCRIGIEHHQLLNLESVEFNYKFKRSCKNEIIEHCSSSKNKLEVVHCLSEIILNDTLLENQHRIGEICRTQLRFEIFQLNENIKLDPELESACSEDIKLNCKDVKMGKGQVLECLRSNSKKLSKSCKTKLFKRDRINLVEQGGDYSLQTKCKNSIQQYCHVDGEEDAISCLRKHLLKAGFEPGCRFVVINRIMTQNNDVRLNPSLWKACSVDAVKNCKTEFANADEDDMLKGRVIKCLKTAYTKDLLSQACESEIDQIMREAANVDYRLDPLLAENCITELEDLCSDSTNDKKEDCLRLAFQNKKIRQGTQCFEEVRRIIVEGAADVFVDHELSSICANDLNRYCNDVAPGASQQLKCLLNIKNSKKEKISPRCADKLESRQELWQLARVSDNLSGFNDLAKYINESQHRSYFLTVLFLISVVIFALGCFCRPAIFRNRRDKMK